MSSSGCPQINGWLPLTQISYTRWGRQHQQQCATGRSAMCIFFTMRMRSTTSVPFKADRQHTGGGGSPSQTDTPHVFWRRTPQGKHAQTIKYVSFSCLLEDGLVSFVHLLATGLRGVMQRLRVTLQQEVRSWTMYSGAGTGEISLSYVEKVPAPYSI